MSDSLRACPKCLTLNLRATPVCSECHQPLRWISDVADLDDSLTLGNNAGWKHHAIVTARFGNEAIDAEREQAGTFDLTIDSDKELICELDASLRQMTVRLGDTEKTLDIPGEAVLDSVHIRARLVARLRSCPPVAPRISEQFEQIVVPVEGTILGRRQADSPHRRVLLQWADVAMDHCLLVTEPDSQEDTRARWRYWLVDLGSSTGTFVNREPVLCHQLFGQDLVQVGPFAWTFYASEGLLVPTERIKGVSLQLRGVQVGRLLGPLDVDVQEGELVAIVGVSGSGKSTLLKTIVGTSGYRGRGTIQAGDVDAARQPEQFRNLLGYIPQQSVIHPDLKCEQSLRFSGSLRCSGPGTDWRTILQQVDFPRNRWHASPEGISGGELRRLDTAAELVTEPKLLLMDEPTTGLDPGREQSIFKLLQNLRNRGCTVVVVTHSISKLEMFDRVLVIHHGMIGYDGSPQDLLRQVPSGHLEDFRGADSPPSVRTSLAPTTVQVAPKLNLTERIKRAGRQSRLLFQRECRRFANHWLRRMLPLVGVPVFFAIAIHLAVAPVDLEGMGFLSLLSCIWLGASLSLLAVADERKIVDHERLVFLQTTPYILAKTAFYWMLSGIQTTVFFLFLLWLRTSSEQVDDMLYGWPRVLLCLALVGWASVGLGMTISALVGPHRQLATAILPLVMMVQIVFSAQVMTEGNSLHEKYKYLHLHACHGAENCPEGLRAERWVKPKGTPRPTWLCGECARHTESADPHASGDESKQDDQAVGATEIPQTWKREVNATAELETQKGERPPTSAVLATYFTISRYGDIALRSFAYSRYDYGSQFNENDDSSDPASSRPSTARQAKSQFIENRKLPDAAYYRYETWRIEALGMLLLMAIALPVLSGCVLRLQASTFWERCTWFSIKHYLRSIPVFIGRGNRRRSQAERMATGS